VFPFENHALVYVPEVLLVRPVPLVDEPQTQPFPELAELHHVHEALHERRSRLDEAGLRGSRQRRVDAGTHQDIDLEGPRHQP